MKKIDNTIDSNKVEIQKNNTNSCDLIYIDIAKSFGDVLIWIQVLKILDKNKGSYICFVHDVYKDLINSLDFKNINFIFNKLDFGYHYDRTKGNIDERIEQSILMSKYLEDIKIKNIYLLSYSIIIDNIIFLSKIKYEKLFCFCWNKKAKLNNVVIFGDYLLGILYTWKFFNHNLITYKIDRNKNGINNALTMFGLNNISSGQYFCMQTISKKKSIAIMPFTSNPQKNLDFIFLKVFLEYIYKFHKDLEINIYGMWKKEHESEWLKHFKNSKLNFTYKVNMFSNPKELMKDVSKNKIIITNDTSLYHIGIFYNKNIICFYNKFYTNKNIDMKSFWLDYGNSNRTIIQLDDVFFSKSSKKNKKELIKAFIYKISKEIKIKDILD